MPDPLQVETQDRAFIFNAESGDWFSAWQTIFRPFGLYVPINISSIGTHTIITRDLTKRIKIVSLFFTVAVEVNITLLDGSIPISGPMDFGGASEPRGIAVPFPFTPLELIKGNAFKIALSASVQVSGSVCFYYQ